MFETVRTALIDWSRRTSDRQKLQHTYIVLLMVIVFLAGLVALFNGTRSRQLMYVAIALLTTLATNFVVWSLLKTSLLEKLSTRPANSGGRATRR